MTWLLPLIDYHVLSNMGFPGGSDSKEPPCNAREPEFDSWVGKIKEQELKLQLAGTLCV